MTQAISVQGVSKKYQIGLRDQANQTFREAISSAVTSPLRRLRQLRGEYSSEEDFWALRDVSFDIQPGEVVGIIGHNGAGKSTLLKILSRITEPSSGRIEINGRVASLLEVGTGFHPELTGRENIYLNGAILGMRRREIDRKFDEIVAFAEVEKFLDTPVKRYSTGMQVRLAFAVAAHLDPEILIIDEVLAVGDAKFQQKCLGKMQDVATGGRTVLFVSHNMNAVEELCSAGLLLNAGKVLAFENNVRDLVMQYTGARGAQSTTVWQNRGPQFENRFFKPNRVTVGDRSGRPATSPLRNDSEICIWIEGEVEIEDPALEVGYQLVTAEGKPLFWSLTTDTSENGWPAIKRGHCKLLCVLPTRFLNEGEYRIELSVSLHWREWICRPGDSPCVAFSIQGGLSDSPYWMHKRPGYVAPVLGWEVLMASTSIL